LSSTAPVLSFSLQLALNSDPMHIPYPHPNLPPC
jgi:hypothetical protein